MSKTVYVIVVVIAVYVSAVLVMYGVSKLFNLQFSSSVAFSLAGGIAGLFAGQAYHKKRKED